MERVYKQLVLEHFRENQQMLFLMGPRQVGKSTICLALKEAGFSFYYFNWDDEEDREKILLGGKTIANEANLSTISHKPIIVFDEIHKFARWKLFLKGFYDKYRENAHIVVTGSTRLDVYHRGGDSLMGRYLLYRVHPFSVAEVIRPKIIPTHPISCQMPIEQTFFERLYQYGGFPDPFIKNSDRFYQRWKTLKNQQLFREDLRDLTQVQALDQIETLATMIRHQVGQLTTFESLSKKIRVADTTARRWIQILISLYYCYAIRPWSKNVPKSLRKEPKYYLWDWSLCTDDGSKTENMIASHLLKAVHFWTDYGFGDYALHFLRDKGQREVDFVIVKNNTPWILIEVKKSINKGISPALEYYHNKLQTEHAFQVVLDAPYANVNCFDIKKPIIVPAVTFLSQLI